MNLANCWQISCWQIASKLLQYYAMFCSCMELKICHKVMCKQTFANCSQMFVTRSRSFAKFFLQSTVFDILLPVKSYT